jgi:hypothetical protein
VRAAVFIRRRNVALVQLTLESLKDLDDGRVSAAFVHELKRAVQDCMDRPGDKHARSVSLEFKVTPIVADDGSCEGADGEFDIKSKVPTRKSKTYSFKTNKQGHLSFSSNSPDNVDQTTFEDLDGNGRVRR